MPVITSTNFKMGASIPIDDRMTVKTLAERNRITTLYKGLKTFVEDVGKEFLWNGMQWIDTTPSSSIVVVGSNEEKPLLIEPTMPHVINVIEGVDEGSFATTVRVSGESFTLSMSLNLNTNPEGTEVLPEGFVLYINNLSDKNVVLDMPLLGYKSIDSEGVIEGLFAYDARSITLPALSRFVLKWINMIDREVYGFLLVHEFFELTFEEYNELYETKEKVEELEASVADLLYTPIEISSFTHNAGTKEMGATVSELTFSWKTNKTPTTIILKDEENPEFKIDIEADATSYKLTDLDFGMSNKPIYQLVVTDERGLHVYKFTEVNFCNGVYYGKAVEPEAYNSEFILDLSKSLRASKLTNFTVTPGEGEYIYYCLPTRMGTCTFTVGGFTGGFTLVDTISFTNASGYTEEYYIYKSDTANLGSTTVSVS